MEKDGQYCYRSVLSRGFFSMNELILHQILRGFITKKRNSQFLFLQSSEKFHLVKKKLPKIEKMSLEKKKLLSLTDERLKVKHIYYEWFTVVTWKLFFVFLAKRKIGWGQNFQPRSNEMSALTKQNLWVWRTKDRRLTLDFRAKKRKY